MRVAPLVLALMLCVHAVQTRAQSSFIAGSEVDGQIRVQVNVTLDDGAGDYNPIANFRLTLYRNATDSTVLNTDDAGVLRFATAPGTYRLASAVPTQYRGRSYHWNLPLEVRRGIGVVALTAGNAAISPAIDVVAKPRSTQTSVGEAAPTRQTRDASRKDGTTAVMFGLFLPGGGQFYAGRPGKALAILGIDVAALEVASQRCNRNIDAALDGGARSYTCGKEFGAFGTVVLVTWMYGMLTAREDVRHYNEERAGVAAIRPLFNRDDERAEIGLAVRF